MADPQRGRSARFAAGRGGGEPGPDDERAVDDPGDPEDVARIICLRMLEQRARTRSELDTALHRKGVPELAARAVLDRFTDLGLIDDAALAESFTLAQHRERGLSARAVGLKLRRRGVEEEQVSEALALIDADSEREMATELATRKLRTLSGLAPEVRLRRLVGLLGRRGYSPGLSFEVARAVLGSAPAEFDELGSA